MLESLAIKNFRCLQHFEIDKLGRVNLIVGKNNAGKSTVLEALRIHAGHANKAVLESIAQAHDETLQDLFTGRRFPADDDWEHAIQIGDPLNPASKLCILHAHVSDTEERTEENGVSTVRRVTKRVPKTDLAHVDGPLEQVLYVVQQERALPTIFLNPDRFVPDTLLTVPCGVVQTQWMSMDELAGEWDRIVFTEHEDIVRRALKIITPEFENLTFVRTDEGVSDRLPARQKFQRSAKVKLSNSPTPVALKSLGDGMLRILQIALKLVAARGGFLLIDEFENGLHYSVQEKVWTLLFEMAAQLDIQIFATTHSWDCIDSFSKVALAKQDIDGVLFRVGRSVRTSDRGRVIATVFDEEALYSITQSDVEVR
ncbi:ATP-binding protein [uncultured Sphaerotilus sp.]|uniref:AAA family ATPase n=1 Tax=uncultured Sphaerotilus sp. TaxID=474984 RepID=UPI0030CA4CF9